MQITTDKKFIFFNKYFMDEIILFDNKYRYCIIQLILVQNYIIQIIKHHRVMK